MKHLELEKELTARIRKRRLIEGGVTVFLFVMGIVFAVLYENSKVYEKGLLGEGAHQRYIIDPERFMAKLG